MLITSSSIVVKSIPSAQYHALPFFADSLPALWHPTAVASSSQSSSPASSSSSSLSSSSSSPSSSPPSYSSSSPSASCASPSEERDVTSDDSGDKGTHTLDTSVCCCRSRPYDLCPQAQNPKSQNLPKPAPKRQNPKSQNLPKPPKTCPNAKTPKPKGGESLSCSGSPEGGPAPGPALLPVARCDRNASNTFGAGTQESCATV